MFDSERMPAMYVYHKADGTSESVTEDSIILAKNLNTTPDAIMKSGYGYWLTWLTRKEANFLGAKAYLERSAK